MKTYTKEQLIDAQIKWNENYESDPSMFKTSEQIAELSNEQNAKEQIEYLLELIN